MLIAFRAAYSKGSRIDSRIRATIHVGQTRFRLALSRMIVPLDRSINRLSLTRPPSPVSISSIPPRKSCWIPFIYRIDSYLRVVGAHTDGVGSCVIINRIRGARFESCTVEAAYFEPVIKKSFPLSLPLPPSPPLSLPSCLLIRKIFPRASPPPPPVVARYENFHQSPLHFFSSVSSLGGEQRGGRVEAYRLALSAR